MRTCRGFTLIELLMTLTLLSIVLAMGIPALGTAIEGQGVIADARVLQRVVRVARHNAISSGRRVIVCPIDSSNQCSHDWTLPIAVFTDQNNDKTINGDDRVIYRWGHERNSVVRWRGFGSGYLRLSKQGYAAENGSFTLCPASGAIHRARQLVVNRVGRSYLSRDRDNDGIVEYGRDREPEC